MSAKDIIFRKKIEGVIYDILPQTSFGQVLNADGKNLNEVVTTLTTAIGTKAAQTDFQALKDAFDGLVKDAPETYDTLKEIGDYLTTHQSEYEALLAVAGGKVDKVEGKGLSTEDFTTELKTKLENLVDQSALTAKLKDLADADAAMAAKLNKLDGADDVEGSVAHVVKAAVDPVATQAEANKTAIATINDADNGILAQAKADATVKANDAQAVAEANAKKYTDDEVKKVADKKGRIIVSETEPADLTENDLWVYCPATV